VLEIVTSNESRAHIALVGKLDTSTSSQLGRYFDGLGNEELADARIDMSHCEFVSSAGLRVIVAMQKRVSSVGGKMAFYAVPPEIMEVFELTGFDKILTFR
jgi:anti-anti-sigma factor